ncbi:MAG TPA: hypothetical protein VHC70_08620 [Phycisphaerales bacterium]|nr:hypothetical protein [Phycisphaerales bacterium]
MSLASLAIAPASLCLAQPVIQLRLVERTGQSTVTSADTLLNFAVQGRVDAPDAAVGIGGFAFSIIIDGEAQNWGTLARDRISNPDGTYYPGVLGPGSGYGNGIAAQYAYLAGISSIFNGLINSSGGGWTQTPSQDIGLISGLSAGRYFLGTPGVDTDGDGVPDTASGESAKLPPSVMTEYFGAKGTWIDLYRFRYTVTDLTPRELDFHIATTSTDADPVGFYFTEAQETSGNWGTINTQIAIRPEDITGLEVQVVPASGPGAPLLVALGWGARRRRRRVPG